ncbi:MAG TPA: Crp/Fnr family transcriptional regulator [Burkholderiales bacterium]|nr:Crp/Fnr family transcriptional regulator [Burkholderiales bacterium]
MALQPAVVELESIPLFSGLPRRVFARLAKGAQTLDVARGTMLYANGDACGGIHAVVSGRVSLALRGPQDAERVVALVGRGETFGEAAALLGQPHFMCAEALVPTHLIFVAKSVVLASMSRDVAFADRMAVSLARRLRRVMHEVENMTLHSGTDRVVDFLVAALADAPSQGAAIVELPAKKRIIASHLDLTQEHFSRILHELAAERLLVVQGPRVSIPDIARLRAYHEESYALPASTVRRIS